MNEQSDGTNPVTGNPVGHMTALDEAACIELIEAAPVGRIGFIANGAPLVLPVNHAWWEESIVFRTLEGKKLAAAGENQMVCFEIDHWDPGDRTGWSVVVQGTAREVTAWAELAQLEEVGLIPWVKDQWRTCWVRIDPSEISGRALGSRNR